VGLAEHGAEETEATLARVFAGWRLAGSVAVARGTNISERSRTLVQIEHRPHHTTRQKLI